MEVKYPDVKVQLTGGDSNVFAIIGAVARGLRRSGRFDEAEAFVKEATSQGSYDAVLQLCMRTVEVE